MAAVTAPDLEDRIDPKVLIRVINPFR